MVVEVEGMDCISGIECALWRHYSCVCCSPLRAFLVTVILNYETDQPNDLNEICEVARCRIEYQI